MSVARGAEAQPVIDAGNERYDSRRLANGLAVALAEDHRVPLVGISISYAVGETQDPADMPGVAGLIAKLLPSLGTRHLPDGSEDLLGAAGFYPWRVESFTQTRETVLNLLVPAAAVDLALFIEADRMGFAADGLTDELLDWAKGSQQQAFRAKPGGERVTLSLGQLLYGPQHPYWADGVAPELERVSLDWLRARLRRHYGVSGARLSIVGDIEPKRVMASVEQTFGRLRGRAASLPSLPAPTALRQPVEVKAKDVYDGVIWGWRTPRYLDDDDIALDVVARYLGHRLSQRLAVGDKRALVRARQASMDSGSTFWLALPTTESRSRAAVEALARAELDALSAGKPDAAELELAKATIEREIADSMDDLRSRARLMSQYTDAYGRIDGFQSHLQSYQQLDAQRLAQVVKRHLGSDPVVVSSIEDKALEAPVITPLPKATYQASLSAEQLPTPDALEWYRPPGVVATPRFDPPRIFELMLGQSRLMYMPRFGLPTVKLRLGLNWQGAVPVPALRALTLRCLLRSKPNGSAPLRDRLSDLGASLQVDNDHDSFSLLVTTSPERADAVVAALRESLGVERFDSELFSKVHEELLKELSEAKSKEWDEAYHWIEALEYPARHRYYTKEATSAGRLAVLRALDQKKLEAFWKSQRRAENLTVSLVGPVDEERARALGKAALPAFPSGKPAASSLSPAKGLFLVDAKPAEGDDVRVQFSWPAPKPDEPGHADALALRWLFGATTPLRKLLEDNGVKTHEDWFANLLTERDQSHLVFAVRVPKAQLGGVLRAVRLYADSLRNGEMTWSAVQDARREVLQWVVERFRGASGCMEVVAGQADLRTSSTSTADLYLFAQRIDKASLTKAAAILIPDNASVLAYGAVAGLETELADTPYGKPQLASATKTEKVR